MLIVGSKALLYHYNLPNRNVKDIDIIGNKSNVEYLINSLIPNKVIQGNGIITLSNIQNKNEFYNTNNVEILLYDESEALSEYIKYEESMGKIGDGLFYASPEVLLSLKKSHIHFPIFFKKHISDYAFLLDKMGEDKLSHITKKASSLQSQEKRIIYFVRYLLLHFIRQSLQKVLPSVTMVSCTAIRNTE